MGGVLMSKRESIHRDAANGNSKIACSNCRFSHLRNARRNSDRAGVHVLVPKCAKLLLGDRANPGRSHQLDANYSCGYGLPPVQRREAKADKGGESQCPAPSPAS
jgi:hypothetical protein